MITHYEYYKSPIIRKRLKEYCSFEDNFSAEYLVGYGEHFKKNISKPYKSLTVEYFDWILDNSLDIFRSYWDRYSTLFVLDIEYYNLDFGGNIYLKPKMCFEKIEPIYKTVKNILKDYNIEHLTIMTGQGYHFSFKLNFNSKLHEELENIGYIEDELLGKYNSTTSRRKKIVTKKAGLGYSGAGRLLEYIFHKILINKPNDTIPVNMSDIATNNLGYGREGISIDLTCFSDPLYMRDIRLPFSTHQKHKIQRYKVGEYISQNIPIQLSLVRTKNITLDELLKIRRNFKLAEEYAESINCIIPSNSEKGIKKLIDEYKKSNLYKFHKAYDSINHDHFTEWERTYDMFDIRYVPPCLSHAIRNPNPELLKPTNILHLARLFLAIGWEPKHIAGFLRSKYERDYSWSVGWDKYDATSRANFWIRVYVGLMVEKLDQFIDLNCISHAEKGFCNKPWCGYNLEYYKNELEKIFI